MMKFLFAALSGFVLCVSPQPSRADDTKLAVIVFPGVQNLPMFAAQAKGFYAKRGLNVEIKFTPNSDELRNGLAEARYQIAHSAVDNAFALKDKANVDIACGVGRRQQLQPSHRAARYRLAGRYQRQNRGRRRGEHGLCLSAV